MSRDPVRNLIVGLKYRDASDPVELLDAAYWMKGCSSLGRLRYAVLVAIGKTRPHERRETRARRVEPIRHLANGLSWCSRCCDHEISFRPMS